MTTMIPNLYPRDMEMVGRVVLIVVGTIVVTLAVLAQILELLPVLTLLARWCFGIR
jgi:hypothetical protein